MMVVSFSITGLHATAQVLYEESVALRCKMGDKEGIAESLGNLGDVASTEHKSAARKHILDSLRLRQETDERFQQTSCLIGAGLVLLFYSFENNTLTMSLRHLHTKCERRLSYFMTRRFADGCVGWIN